MHLHPSSGGGSQTIRYGVDYTGELVRESHPPQQVPQSTRRTTTDIRRFCPSLSDMKTVEIDEKGRVVIPKDVRVKSGISTPGQLLVTVEGSGKIGLQSIETNLRKAQEIGRRKLSSWREERHDEDRLALRLTREGKPR